MANNAPIPRVIPMPDKMGWGLRDSIQEKHEYERRTVAQYIEENPHPYQAKESKQPLPEIIKKYEDLMESAGRNKKSRDLTLLDYFILKRRLRWFQQDGGTCVWSNTFRMIVMRMLFELGVLGDPEEYFGTEEFSEHSIAPHCVQYGFARQLANMRGGDGLYGAPMSRSLSEGMVMCNTPKLIELMNQAGATSPTDYPEPRNLSLYRKIGNWAWNQALQEFRDYRVTETAPVKSIEDLDNAVDNWKPCFQCSGIAIKSAGRHKDGFVIHTEDTRDSWSHNMGVAGKIIGSDDDEFVRISNLSWLYNRTPSEVWTAKPTWDDPFEKYIYNVHKSEVESWFKRGRVEVFTIGEIQMPQSMPTI